MTSIGTEGQVPDIATLSEATFGILAAGAKRSDELRERLAKSFGISRSSDQWPRFVNNYGWALVRLQQQKAVRNLTRGLYERAASAPPANPATSQRTPPIDPDEQMPLPRWAHVMVLRATWKNAKRWGAGPFMAADLRELWRSCGGKCAFTRLEFREIRVGTGRARKPYAPSLIGSIQKALHGGELPTGSPGRELRAERWGDEVFAVVTAAACRHRYSRNKP